MNERSNRSRKNMYRIQRQEIRNREDYLAMTRIETLTAALDQARINAQLNPGPLNDAKVERISCENPS